MVFGKTPVKWNGTGGEISQGTCKVCAGTGCVTSFSLQSHLEVKGGGGALATVSPRSRLRLRRKPTRERTAKVDFLGFSYGIIESQSPRVYPKLTLSFPTRWFFQRHACYYNCIIHLHTLLPLHTHAHTSSYVGLSGDPGS